jgi:hypothetical protein
MGKFLWGLVIGVIVGVLVMAYNPTLPEQIRAGLANVTALVMRGTEKAAETVGEAADKAAEEARETRDEAAGEAAEQPAPTTEEPVQEDRAPPPE